MKYIADPHQSYTTEYIVDNDFAGVFLEMGLGKTVSTLTAIDQLINLYHDVSKVLVVAPKLVAENVWSDEIEKWDHIRHLKYSKILGSAKQRIAATRKQADIYIVNYENLMWLVAQLGGWWPYDMVVWDESSKMKNHASKRFKEFKPMLPFIRRAVLLSGTPLGNGYVDLWAPIWLLDRGKRLGVNISTYRNDYLKKNHSGFGYTLAKPEYANVISSKISDICVSMRQKDYLSLPERIERDIVIKMSSALVTRYKEFKRDRVMELLESGVQITAVNAAALTIKLLQFTSGAIYDEDRGVHEIHDLKIQALVDFVDTAMGRPVLIFYQFQHELDRIMKVLKPYKPEVFNKTTVARWNRKEIAVLAVHPKSAGHGLNLQAGGNIILWFSQTWSNEEFKQAVARLERKGQTESVIVGKLILHDTVDETVLAAQNRKAGDEAALMEAVKAIIREYKPDFEYGETEDTTYDFI